MIRGSARTFGSPSASEEPGRAAGSRCTARRRARPTRPTCPAAQYTNETVNQSEIEQRHFRSCGLVAPTVSYLSSEIKVKWTRATPRISTGIDEISNRDSPSTCPEPTSQLVLKQSSLTSQVETMKVTNDPCSLLLIATMATLAV